jgi:SAM-dependent methyltransferase
VNSTSKKLQSGNWVRRKILVILGVATLGALLFALLPLPSVVRVVAGITCLILFISFFLPAYSYYMFSPRGGNLQEAVYTLILTHLGDAVQGRALDIGSGNGVLAVKLAQKFPRTQVTGMDYWGKNWEYSKTVCEENAQIAGVSERIRFVKGDAAALEFSDASFDAVVSNLTFHEVKSAHQKIDVMIEALRVLKPGGTFAFVDYFYDGRFYGEATQFQNNLQHLGLRTVQVKPLKAMLALPRILLHPKILGKVGIVYGAK